MNFWQHLGELRQRLIRCIYVLLAGTIAGAFAVNPVIAWLVKPIHQPLVFVRPTEAFAAQVKIAVAVSFLIGLPYFIYQAWAFVAAGLEEREKNYFRFVVPSSYLLFLAGAAFASFIIFPKAVAFLLTLKSDNLQPMLSVESYLDFFGLLGLAFGLLFELPIVMHFLAKLGLLRAEFLESNRRLCYAGIFVLATIFNPVPEVFTQLLLAFSAIALFEISVLLVKREVRRQNPIEKIEPKKLKE
jgi:sec-independent protein translocase protein TatC